MNKQPKGRTQIQRHTRMRYKRLQEQGMLSLPEASVRRKPRMRKLYGDGHG